jgi:YjbR
MRAGRPRSGQLAFLPDGRGDLHVRSLPRCPSCQRTVGLYRTTRTLQLNRGRNPGRVPPVGRRASAFDRPAGWFGGARVSVPVQVPEDIVDRVRALCLALPEVSVRVDYSLTRARSTAQSFDIRRRSFCLLVAVGDPTGKPVPLLVLRVDPDDREAFLSVGHPFFASRAGRDRVGVLLTDDTDWEEIRELVTESYRVLAPKKLTALLG